MKCHPLAVILFFLGFMCIVLINDNPLLSILYLVYISLFLSGEIGYKKMLKNMKAAFWTILSIIIINPLVSRGGSHVLYRGIRLPLVGRLIITLEGICFGMHMSIKLMAIYLLFFLTYELSDQDDMFSFFSRYAYKLTLLLSFSLNMAHRLVGEVQRVKEVMMMRGLQFHNKSILKRIKAYYPLLKVILISSLEGSIERAESLYSKGYGKQQPTRYKGKKLSLLDGIVMTYMLLLVGMTLWARHKGLQYFRFYPHMTGISLESLKYIGLLGLLLLTNLIIIWRRQRWKLLQYKI
ncbi:MAG: energy-coupling factor transporter transmembrane component T [Peptostreptococcales bacterium]|jgi:energy-coupling factor transport system permease protein